MKTIYKRITVYMALALYSIGFYYAVYCIVKLLLKIN